MYYQFEKGVYLVKGSKYGCIYDTPHNLLHKINMKAYTLLRSAADGSDSFDVAEEAFLQQMEQAGVLRRVETIEHPYKSIEEVYCYERDLDFVWVEITNKCNLRCIHCYNENDRTPKRTMTLDEFQRVVDQLTQNGVKRIILIGGEPFMVGREMLFDMMDYLSPKVESFELFTNGTLLTEAYLKEMEKRYDNIRIATSLHSYIKEEQDRVTQTDGAYDKTVSMLRCLGRTRIPHRFVGTLMSGLDIGDDSKLGIGNPSRRDFVRLAGRANLRLYDDNLLRKRMITEQTMHSGNVGERIARMYDESCFAKYLYIGSDMNVYPCPMERRVTHGNLREADLDSMLHDKLSRMSKADVEGCRGCEYRYLCRDCRPDSLNDDFLAKPWYCSYRPESGTWETFEEFKNRIYNN